MTWLRNLPRWIGHGATFVSLCALGASLGWHLPAIVLEAMR